MFLVTVYLWLYHTLAVNQLEMVAKIFKMFAGILNQHRL